MIRGRTPRRKALAFSRSLAPVGGHRCPVLIDGSRDAPTDSRVRPCGTGRLTVSSDLVRCPTVARPSRRDGIGGSIRLRYSSGQHITDRFRRIRSKPITLYITWRKDMYERRNYVLLMGGVGLSLATSGCLQSLSGSGNVIGKLIRAGSTGILVSVSNGDDYDCRILNSEVEEILGEVTTRHQVTPEQEQLLAEFGELTYGIRIDEQMDARSINVDRATYNMVGIGDVVRSMTTDTDGRVSDLHVRESENTETVECETLLN